MRRRREVEVFSLSFLDCICCGFGAIILLLVLSEIGRLTGERDALAARFKALADPTRVAIVNSLSAADEVCVCNLTETFELSQPTISHHLKIFREAGLVESSRRGTWAYYRLVPEAIAALRGLPVATRISTRRSPMRRIP